MRWGGVIKMPGDVASLFERSDFSTERVLERLRSCPSGCITRGKVRLPRIKKLSSENAVGLSKGSPGFLEEPVQPKWFTPSSKTSPQSVTVFSGLF